MVTVEGTTALGEVLARLTTQPPAGATLDSVTVPVAALPPTTEAGLKLSEVTRGDRTDSVALTSRPCAAADIRTDEPVATAATPTVNVTELEPAGMTIELGIWQIVGTLSESETVTPLGGATPFRLTVAVEEPPPTTDAGERLKRPRLAGVIERTAVFDIVPNLAEIVAEVLIETPAVEKTNAVEDSPAGIVTEPGKSALRLEEESVMVAPFGGAIPFSVTVPLELSPPTIEDGDSETLRRVAPLIVRAAAFVAPPPVAVIFAVWTPDTAEVKISNVDLDAPAGTVRPEGIDTAELLAAKFTTNPDPGAFLESCTVPVAESPPATEFGEIVIELTA
jgi:hypothetical protein